MLYICGSARKPLKSPGLYHTNIAECWELAKPDLLVDGSATNLVLQTHQTDLCDEAEVNCDLSAPLNQRQLIHALDCTAFNAIVLKRYVNPTTQLKACRQRAFAHVKINGNLLFAMSWRIANPLRQTANDGWPQKMLANGLCIIGSA